jgi:hypothetical protein
MTPEALKPKVSSATPQSEVINLPTFSDASDRTLVNLTHKSAMIVDAFPDRIPNARELEDMTRSFGLELVSVALAKILSSISPNRIFLERVDRTYRDIRLDSRTFKEREKDLRESHARVPLEERAELCVIESVSPLTPGAKWGAHVEDWRSWGRRAGLTTDVIQTIRGKSLIANAEIIRRELASQPHDRRIIATIGQGSAEFRLLIEQLLKTAPHELDGIQMWINVAGLVRGGTGITKRRSTWWSEKMMALSCALRGWPSSIGRQLSSVNPRLRAEPELQGLPFVCVSMVGFPNVTQVPAGLKGAFMDLARTGPNDGVTLFHESIVRPGYIVPIPGMSHRAEIERLGPWFQAVLAAFAFDRKPVASE